MIVIKHKATNAVLLEIEADTLEEAVLRKVDLKEADLSGQNLDAAILSGADLRGANLAGAELNGADLTFADLRNADLTGASLQSATLYNTLLQNANLTDANLIHTQFSSAHFSGTDFSSAILGETTFSACNKLYEAIGLTTINHVEDSSIDDDTLKEKIESIPDEFLLGCGFTDERILELRTRYGPFYSCFISYARRDRVFVEKLYADLIKNHVSCWRDEVHLRAGRNWKEGIERALSSRDKVLLICSKNSIESTNVQQEIITTIEFERLHGVHKLIVLYIDEAINSLEQNGPTEAEANWVSVAKTNQMLDFREWKKKDQYSLALRNLLRDLKQVD